jgi:hypothetical protein
MQIISHQDAKNLHSHCQCVSLVDKTSIPHGAVFAIRIKQLPLQVRTHIGGVNTFHRPNLFYRICIFALWIVATAVECSVLPLSFYQFAPTFRTDALRHSLLYTLRMHKLVLLHLRSMILTCGFISDVYRPQVFVDAVAILYRHHWRFVLLDASPHL